MPIWKTLLLTTGIMALFAGHLAGQIPTFQKRYGGAGADNGYHILEVANGYLIACGVSPSGTGSTDASLLALDANGNVLWQRTYGGPNDDKFTLVTEANDGGFLAMGETLSQGQGGNDVLLVKTDQNGNVQWSKTIGGSDHDNAPIYGKIVKFPDGYLISGLQFSFPGNANNGSYFIRLDNAGNVVWRRGLTSSGVGNQIVSTYIEGNIIYAGGGADGDACFATLDLSSGQLLSARRYGGAFNETVYNIYPTSDGNLLLSDGTWSAENNTEMRQLLMKTDKNGEVIWTKIYGKPGFSLRGIATNAADGGFLLAPFAHPVSNQRDAYLAKTDADGNLQWSYNYSPDNPSADFFYQVIQTADGGIIAVGSTRDENGFDDIFVVKTTAEGLVTNGCVEPFDLSVADYTLPGFDQAFGVNDFAPTADWNLTAQDVTLPSANTCANTTGDIVNDYTPVLGFSGCDSTLLQVGSVAGFAAGDEVLLIQMKGAEVDLTNTASFGNITGAGNAGNYEFNRIKSISGNQIALLYKLIRPYDAAGKVQLIRVPEYDDFTTDGLTCKPWDGQTGGVLVLDVANTLTLLGDLDVSGRGFRGGKVVDADILLYHETGIFYPPDPALAAEKGEGIAEIPLSQSYGRGKSANGGGGGNAHNAGGGGGGNAGGGGNGGLEYFNTPGAPTPGTDGVGGLNLFGFDVQKITLGGGGGAGHTNDDVGTSGGNGGGIIIVKANTVNANGFRMLANGEDVIADGTNRNDGQGGGGAGGTILFDVSQVVDNLSFELKGGRGGDCLFFVNSQIIGPGGGGGGGKLALSQLFPTISLNLNGGINGIANQNMTNGAQPGQAGSVLFPLGTLPGGSVLPELPTVHYDISLCPGDSVTIDGVTYTQPATVTDTIPSAPGGCDTVATYTIKVIHIPVLDLGPDVILCVDSTVIFDAGPDFVQYLWQDSSTTQTFAASDVGTYWVEATDSCGFTHRDSVFLTVSLLPDTQFPDTVLCPGDSIYLSLPGFDTYAWTPAAGLSCTDCADIILYPTVTTTYTVLATTADGCILTDTFVVEVLPQPAFTETITFCPGDSIVIGGTTYTQPATVTLVIPSATGGCDTLATYMLEYATPAPSVVTIQCPSNIDIGISPGAGPTVVDYNLPLASTDCSCPGLALELTEGLPSGSAFPPGLTLVCYEAQDSCGNTASCCFEVMIREEQPCDVKKIGCMKYELLSITKDVSSKKTYRIRATNSCNNPLTYIAFQLPNGMTAKKPLNNEIYTAPSGREYLVRNPNYAPFYSIRFKSTTDSISNGESDIFEYTLPAQANPTYIHVTARLEPQVYYEAHINTFYCPVGTTPDPVKPASAPYLNVFPNPTSGELFVDLSAWQGEYIQMQVLDSRGQRVTNLAMTADAAPQLIQLPESLAGGLYFLEILTQSGEKQSLRFVVMR